MRTFLLFGKTAEERDTARVERAAKIEMENQEKEEARIQAIKDRGETLVTLNDSFVVGKETADRVMDKLHTLFERRDYTSLNDLAHIANKRVCDNFSYSNAVRELTSREWIHDQGTNVTIVNPEVSHVISCSIKTGNLPVDTDIKAPYDDYQRTKRVSEADWESLGNFVQMIKQQVLDEIGDSGIPR